MHATERDFSCHYLLCIWKVSIVLDGRRIATLGILSYFGHLFMVRPLGRNCPCNDCFKGGIHYQDSLDAMSFFNCLLAWFVANIKKVGLLGDWHAKLPRVRYKRCVKVFLPM